MGKQGADNEVTGAVMDLDRINTAALQCVSFMGILNICNVLNFIGHSRAGFKACCVEVFGDF